MALTVTHAHQTALPNDAGSDVSADAWNAAHTVTGGDAGYRELRAEVSEVATSQTYTLSFPLPAGARIMDCVTHCFETWTDPDFSVQWSDSDGPLSAPFTSGVRHQSDFGETVGDMNDQPDNGVYSSSGSQTSGRDGKVYPSGDTITAVWTTSIGGGTTGRTTFAVFYLLPTLPLIDVVIS